MGTHHRQRQPHTFQETRHHTYTICDNCHSKNESDATAANDPQMNREAVRLAGMDRNESALEAAGTVTPQAG